MSSTPQAALQPLFRAGSLGDRTLSFLGAGSLGFWGCLEEEVESSGQSTGGWEAWA